MPDPIPPGATLTLENASQARTLDDIGRIGDGMGAAPGAGPAGTAGPGAPLQQDPLALTNATILENTLQALRNGFCDFTGLKAPRAIATDAVIHDLAEGWGKWAAARAIDLKTYMGQHADTIPLALSTAAIAFAVYASTKNEIAAKRPTDIEPKPKQTGEGGAAPGAAAS